MKRRVLSLKKAMTLFNYDGIENDLFVRMIDNNVAVDDACEGVNKQLKAAYEKLTPPELAGLQEEQKTLLAAETPDKEKINIVNVRIQLLQNEQNVKYEKAEETILSQSLNLTITPITVDELHILRREKKQLVDIEQGKRDIVTTNHFSSEDMGALSLLLKKEKSKK